MARRAALLLLGVALAATLAIPRSSLAVEDPRTVSSFLQGLRDRGYFDLAAEYLETLRGEPGTPKEISESIDYELGKLSLDEASRTGDLVRRRDLLDKARGRLDAFTRDHPAHLSAPDAFVQLARLLVERGHLAKIEADDAPDHDGREVKLAEARSAFDQARPAYDTAIKTLSDAYAGFHGFLTVDDPKFTQREETHNALMQAQLQRAVVDYEQAQTHPVGSPPRQELMGKALVQFDALNKSYRTQFTGLTAQMWQGKCYEERGQEGDLGRALGVYALLLEHPDPRLRPLQRHVGYFRIIALGKRKEYPLAADEAVRWLQANNRPELLRDREGLGVQFELAKNLVAQLPDVKDESARSAVTKRIVDVLGQVVRYSSPFKAEALAMLKTYKPSVAANATEISRLNYEDATSQAEEALASQEWDLARSLLFQAIRRAELLRDIDKTNYARYNLAFCDYMSGHYYEAVVLADHLARRYPRGGLSAKAAEIAMAALEKAYNTYTKVDRVGDLNNLTELAKYTAEAFAETDQGDTAKLALGQIHDGIGRYAEAVAAYESVRPSSAKWVEAKTKAGSSHWEQSRLLRRSGKTDEADAEVATALVKLNEALTTRREAGATPSDPGLIDNLCDISDIQLELSKPDEALKLLEPIAKQQSSQSGPAFARLTSTLLRAHIAAGQVDQAVADMAALETAGDGGAGLTQLYFRLGKLLESEMEALRKKRDRDGLERTRLAFLKFLNALAESKSGQTFDSMLWTGENILKLGDPAKAHDVFEHVLKTYGSDASALAQPGAPERVLRTRLKLSASLRGLKRFDESSSMIETLLKENPRTIEPMMEKGMLLEDQAAAGKGEWGLAFNHWRATATRLGTMRTRPVEYYEAWYHAAVALQKQGRGQEAKQTLAGIMRLSPSVGGPEMKGKYQALLAEIK